MSAKNQKKDDSEGVVCAAEECGVAQLKIAKYKYTWILNTSVFKKEVGESVQSPGFTLGDNQAVKWHIELHPKSICRKGFSTLYLCLKSCENVKLQALYKFSIVNSKNEEDLKSYDWCIFTNTDINRTPHYFNVDRLISKTTGTVNNEKFILICKIWFTVDTFEIPQFPEDDCEKLLKYETFSDITLLVSGKELKVHKNILALRSPVFLSMFSDDCKDKKESAIEINNMDFDVMKQVIRYIYTHKVDNLDEIAKDLLPAAHKYALDGLKTMCEESLCKNLNIDNASNCLILAELYKAKTLKKETINYIINNLKQFDMPAFSLLVESQPHLLAEILHAVGKKKDAEVSQEVVTSESEADKILYFFS